MFILCRIKISNPIFIFPVANFLRACPKIWPLTKYILNLLSAVPESKILTLFRNLRAYKRFSKMFRRQFNPRLIFENVKEWFENKIIMTSIKLWLQLMSSFYAHNRIIKSEFVRVKRNHCIALHSYFSPLRAHYLNLWGLSVFRDFFADFRQLKMKNINVNIGESETSKLLPYVRYKTQGKCQCCVRGQDVC